MRSGNINSVLLLIFIAAMAIVIFYAIHRAGYVYYYSNYVPRSKGVGLGIVSWIGFLIVSPALIASTFLNAKRSIALFFVLSAFIVWHWGSGSFALPLRMLLITISYLFALLFIILARWSANKILGINTGQDHERM